jgi:hypothetical protein
MPKRALRGLFCGRRVAEAFMCSRVAVRRRRWVSGQALAPDIRPGRRAGESHISRVRTSALCFTEQRLSSSRTSIASRSNRISYADGLGTGASRVGECLMGAEVWDRLVDKDLACTAPYRRGRVANSSQATGAGGLYSERERPPSTIKEAVLPFGEVYDTAHLFLRRIVLLRRANCWRHSASSCIVLLSVSPPWRWAD